MTFSMEPPAKGEEEAQARAADSARAVARRRPHPAGHGPLSGRRASSLGQRSNVVPLSRASEPDFDAQVIPETASPTVE